MDIQGGAQPPASTFIEQPAPGYVRFVQIRDFDGDSHLTYIQDSPQWRKCFPDDILIARYGASLGRILRGLEGAYNVALAKAVPSDRVNKSFLYYLLRSSFFQGPLAGLGARSVQAGFNRDDLRVIPVPLPPLAEQAAIASILGALDDKIELNRKMNETLEAMARAIFKSWFVDFDPVRAKVEGRQPHGLTADIAARFPSAFHDTSVGKVPIGWTPQAIGEVVRVCGGSTPSTEEPNYWNGTINFATPKDLASLQAPVLLGTERCITEAGLACIGSGLLPKGTVLLSSRAPIGYLAIAEVPVAVNQGFIAMVCDGPLSNQYVLHWTRENIDTIIGRANGTTFLEISKANFRPIEAVVPPPAILTAFTDAVQPLHHRAVLSLRESGILAQLRDTLLPKLLSGEVRVKDADKMVEAVS
jgi:type I restriction enzyme S subunit